MLKRVQTECGDRRSIGMAENAKDAALLAQRIAFEVNRTVLVVHAASIVPSVPALALRSAAPVPRPEDLARLSAASTASRWWPRGLPATWTSAIRRYFATQPLISRI